MTKIVEEFYDSLHCDLHRSLSAHHGAGLETLLDVLEDFHFSSEDLAFLQEQGFDQSFLAYLEDFSFKGTIHSAPKGDLIFPTRLTLQVEANIIEAQIIESLLDQGAPIDAFGVGTNLVVNRPDAALKRSLKVPRSSRFAKKTSL